MCPEPVVGPKVGPRVILKTGPIADPDAGLADRAATAATAATAADAIETARAPAAQAPARAPAARALVAAAAMAAVADANTLAAVLARTAGVGMVVARKNITRSLLA